MAFAATCACTCGRATSGTGPGRRALQANRSAQCSRAGKAGVWNRPWGLASHADRSARCSRGGWRGSGSLVLKVHCFAVWHAPASDAADGQQATGSPLPELQGPCRHALACLVACHCLGGYEILYLAPSWVFHLHGLLAADLADSLPCKGFCHVVWAMSEGRLIVVSIPARH